MTFFATFFAALDGDDPESAMVHVAEGMRFSILWAADTARSRQFVGGPDELRAFTAAGDTTGWAHHLLHVSRDGSTELALGETRWHDGRHIGTFLAAAELDPSGRMTRYLVGRTPVLRFAADGSTGRL